MVDRVCRRGTTSGHARALITAEEPLDVAREVVAQGVSVREAAALSRRGVAPKKAPAHDAGPRDADIIALEKRLSDVIGLKVMIDYKTDGSGRVEIRYKTLEQLDSILAKLG